MKLANGDTTYRREHSRNITRKATAGGGGLAVVIGLLILGHVGNQDSGSRSVPDRGPLFNRVAPSSVWQLPPSSIRSAPSTAARNGREQPQPYWRGAWLMNYWEDQGDCAAGVNDPYWVVQPGTADMYTLKAGCFPAQWTAALNTTCRNADVSTPVCAVWDRDAIMSSYNQHGNLLVIGLTQACLDRAHLDTYRQGDLHQDCVVFPS